MPDLKKMSFELNEEMMALIEKEFAPENIAKQFAEKIAKKSQKEAEKIGQEAFTRYGIDLMKRSRQLGEEYPDRTYEVLKVETENTGGWLAFPLIPQRFIEIAFLSTQHQMVLPVIENNFQRLIFQVEDCKTYAAIQKEAGAEAAKQLLCRHGCLKACETIFKDCGFEDVVVGMNAATNKDGYCEFMVRRV
jgi:hypothetical protein